MGGERDDRMRWLDRITNSMGHESEQAPGDGEGQGRACCSPCGCKESDITESLNNDIIKMKCKCRDLIIDELLILLGC